MSFSLFSTCSPPWPSYYSRVAVEPSLLRKCPHNPTHSTILSPAIYPKPFYPITTVESPGSSGVIGVSSPGWGTYFSRSKQSYLAVKTEGLFKGLITKDDQTILDRQRVIWRNYSASISAITPRARVSFLSGRQYSNRNDR